MYSETFEVLYTKVSKVYFYIKKILVSIIAFDYNFLSYTSPLPRSFYKHVYVQG